MYLPDPGRGQASESQRRYALLRAVPNSSPRWKRRAFFGLCCKRVGYVVANPFTCIAQVKAAPAKNIVGTFDELAWNPSPILHIEAETDNQAVLINPGPKIELQLLGGRRLFFSSSRR